MKPSKVERQAEKTVPCGDCFQCCTGFDAIYMQPEDNNRLYLLQRHPESGRLALQHQENGDCIYLDRSNPGASCTIHDHRPLRCRQFDCRAFLQLSKAKRRQYLRKRIISREIFDAARARVARELRLPATTDDKDQP